MSRSAAHSMNCISCTAKALPLELSVRRWVKIGKPSWTRLYKRNAMRRLNKSNWNCFVFWSRRGHKVVRRQLTPP